MSEAETVLTRLLEAARAYVGDHVPAGRPALRELLPAAPPFAPPLPQTLPAADRIADMAAATQPQTRALYDAVLAAQEAAIEAVKPGVTLRQVGMAANKVLMDRGFEPGEEPVKLTLSEFQILCLLAKRPGWVFTRTQIVDEIRGDNYAVTDRSVDVQIVGLRKKLGRGGTYIETVRGVGYRFKE